VSGLSDRATARKAPPPFEAITTDFVTHGCADAVKEAVGGQRSHLKIVASETGANVEAVKNWVEPRNAPNLTSFFRLARKFPEVKAWALWMLDAQSDLDPEFQKNAAKFMTLILRKHPELLARIAAGVPEAEIEPHIPGLGR
jgi:hypothetical protein